MIGDNFEALRSASGSNQPDRHKIIFAEKCSINEDMLGLICLSRLSVVHNKAQEGFPAKQGRFSFNLLYCSNLPIIEVLQCSRTQSDNDAKAAKKWNPEQLGKEDKFRETTEILVLLWLLLTLCPQWWTKANPKHMFHPITSVSLTSSWDGRVYRKLIFPQILQINQDLNFLCVHKSLYRDTMLLCFSSPKTKPIKPFEPFPPAT